MKYRVPTLNLSDELNENLKNIEKVVDELNFRRDQGLDADLLEKLKKDFSYHRYTIVMQ